MKNYFILFALSVWMTGLSTNAHGREIPDFFWMKKVGAMSYPVQQAVYNVTDYGAKGDALSMNTMAIQKAIDAAEQAGGGIVVFHPGIYLTGSLFVGNNVNLHISKGVTLIGSQDIGDYKKIDTRVAGIEMEWPSALINIIGKKNAAISGDGVINGRGKVFWDKYWNMREDYEAKGLRWIVDYDCERPRGILIAECENVTVRDIVLYQPGFWSLHILYSKHITIDGIIISNNIEGHGPSTDGIDIDSSEYILVQNANINCNDDNFCLKAGRGKVFWDKYWNMREDYEAKGLRWIVDYDCERPRGILIAECENVTVRDIVLYQPGFWSLHILYSKHITIDGIIISNNIEGHGPSTDGIDIDSSEYILVQNANINCNDDNFCLKAGRDSDGLRVNRPCQYVVIRDCVAGSGGGMFTCGSETSGGIRNIVAYRMKGVGTKCGLRFKSTCQRGGVIEDIYLYDIEMIGVERPFVVDLNWNPAYSISKLPKGYDMEKIPVYWSKMLESVSLEQGTPVFRNVTLDNVTASNARTCMNVVGIANSKIENFILRNVCIEGNKAGKIIWAKDWKLDDVQIKAHDELILEYNENVDMP